MYCTYNGCVIIEGGGRVFGRDGEGGVDGVCDGGGCGRGYNVVILVVVVCLSCTRTVQ